MESSEGRTKEKKNYAKEFKERNDEEINLRDERFWNGLSGGNQCNSRQEFNTSPHLWPKRARAEQESYLYFGTLWDFMASASAHKAFSQTSKHS